MATNTGDLYVNIKADIKELKKGLDQATKEVKRFGGKMEKSTKANEGFFKSFAKGRNDVVRLVRQLETLAVATAAVAGTYKLLVGKGIELNRQYESQSLGIAALTSAKTDLVDATGKELSSYEQFIVAQQSTKGVMDDIKKAALDTPASFQQMVGFYQQAIGHAITANGTFGSSMEMVQTNVIQMTKGMSSLGSAMGMEMTKVNEEIRSIMSGNASTDSLLAMVLFGSPSEANEAVRNAKKTTDGLSNLLLGALEPFRNLEEVITFDKAVARLSATFEEMQKGITSDLFDDLTYVFVNLRNDLEGSMDDIIQGWTDAYNEAKAYFSVVIDALSVVWDSISNITSGLSDWSNDIDLMKYATVGFATAFRALSKVIDLFGIGLGVVKTAFWQLTASIGEGINWIQKAWNNLGNIMSQLWADIANGVKDVFASAINWVIKKINELSGYINDAASILRFGEIFGDIEEVKFEKTKANITALGEPISNVATLWKYATDAQKKYKEDVEKLDFSDVFTPEKDMAQYDAVKNASSYRQGIESSYEGAKNIADATEAIAAATQAAIEAANGDVGLLERIGTESKKALTNAEAMLIKQKAIVKAKGKGAEADKNSAKAQNKAQKEYDRALKRAEKASKKYFSTVKDLSMDLGVAMADAIGGTQWGDALNEVFKFYDTVMDLQTQFSEMKSAQTALAQAQSVASSQVEGAAAAPAAVSKAGSQAGLYGAIAMAGILSALGVLGTGIFNSGPSAKELEAARGRTEYDDQSLSNLQQMYEDAQYPLLEVSNSMNTYLRNMDKNFTTIAKSLTGTGVGVTSLTGEGYIPKYDEALGGIWGTTTSELLGSGIQFLTTNIQELMAATVTDIRGYITEAVTETSWFGFVEDTDIKFRPQDLDPRVLGSFGSAFTEGYKAILLASASLGFDADAIKSELDKASFILGDETGKLSLEGLSDEEVAQRLSDALSGAFSGVLTTVDELSPLIDRYAQTGEEALETLGRIAFEFDQASFSFDLIGKDFSDGVYTVTKTWTETTDIFTDNMGTVLDNYNSFTNNFSAFSGLFGTAVESITRTITETSEEIYTAQMQVLDIVEGAGGMDSFTDAMSSFMANFYDETEQLEFMTKAMQISFDTLGVAMPKTNAEFRELIETMDTSTQEGAKLYGEVLVLSDSFAQMTSAADDLADSVDGVVTGIQDVADAWLGTLSYLTAQQKADFASGYLSIASDSKGEIDTVEAARLAAETALRSTATKEEYIPVFERYINELEDNLPASTLDDVVDRLDNLIDTVKDQERTLRKLA